MWRPAVEGLHHVPRTGGVILASNHLSFVDCVVIPSVVPRKVVFLAKSDYFTGTGRRRARSRAWFEGLGMLPVDRDDTKAAIASLDIALEVLGAGRRSASTPRAPARATAGSTAAAPASRTSRSPPACPVVPVGLTGTEDIQPVGSNRPRLQCRSPCASASRSLSRRFDGVPSGRARRDLTDRIMAADRRPHRPGAGRRLQRAAGLPGLTGARSSGGDLGQRGEGRREDLGRRRDEPGADLADAGDLAGHAGVDLRQDPGPADLGDVDAGGRALELQDGHRPARVLARA